MACQSRRVISSSGRPDLPEHAAGIVDQDVDVAARASHLRHHGRNGLLVGHVEPPRRAERPGQRRRLGQFVVGGCRRR